MSKTFNIEMLENEKWWGGTSCDELLLPFDCNTTIERDLLYDGNNQAMPLYISTLGRCIWSEEPFKITFNNGKISVEGRSDVLFEKSGETLREAYIGAMQRHFPPNGKDLPKEFFKLPQYNTWMQLLYDQTQEGVLSYAKAIVENGFKPGILMIDEGWQKDYGNWTFDTNKFPDAKGMIRELHTMGFSVMLWVVPYVRSDGRRFLQSVYDCFNPEYSQECFLRAEDGSVAIQRWWNGYSAVLDLNKKYDYEYLKNQLDILVEEYGVDGFKCDGGALYAYAKGGTGGSKISEAYTAAERNIAWNEFGRQYKFHEYKDTFKGGGKRVIQRIRDRNHTWDNEGLNTLVPGGIMRGLIGHPFLCPDMIGGGDWIDRANGVPIDQELFVRMAQCSALFPMMQFSLLPWEVLDDEHLQLVKQAHDLHLQFSDVILELVEEAYRTGEPMLRSLEYNYPHCGYEKVNDIFMLGTRYLVAPILQKGQTKKEIILPEGEWLGFDGKTYVGGKRIVLEVRLKDLPYFKRIGAF